MPPDVVSVVPVEIQAKQVQNQAAGQFLLALIGVIGGALVMWRGCVLLDFK